jgi:predicted SAM-dependent methyltransferase
MTIQPRDLLAAGTSALPGLAPRRVLNAGCGPRGSRRIDAMFDPVDWSETRLDLDAAVEPDVIGTMTDLRPHFESGSFEAVWSSHSLEHLPFHAIPVALGEFRRVLRADGFAVITCPDLETVMTLFLRHGPDHVIYQSAAGPITPSDMLFGHAASIAAGHDHMAHRSGLTAERLGTLLTEAGFAEALVARKGYDLWAVALMPEADPVAVLDPLAAAGLDLRESAA